MPYFVTEPVKIEGTSLGYALYPYQFSFLDNFRASEDNSVRLYIFVLKESEFIEIKKPLYKKDFSISMQNSVVIEETLKKFVIKNEQYIKNVEELQDFFSKRQEPTK